ncbi:MAG: thrombospondin type 3 repeat-containing protein [Myxococcales bacterium]|nr:thrombospondin type 3 repeat-containing protein [Myxococcales bacterium]
MDARRCQIGSGRWACAAALLLAPAGAAVAQPRPVVIQAELGAAVSVPDAPGVGACAAVRVHAPWVGSFGPRFGAARCSFTDAPDLYTVGGGLAWRPALHRRVRLVLEAEAGLGLVGGVGRALVGGAVGADVAIIDGLTVGPSLRYQQLIAGSAGGDDPRYASLAVVVGLSSELFDRPRARPAPEPARPVAAPVAPPVATPPVATPPAPRTTPPPPPTPPVVPTVDRDHDGVPDASDACPAEAPGWLPDPVRPGCPLPDRDRDLVPDASDVCPAVTGAPHEEAPLHGCPGAMRVDGQRLRIDEPLVFDIVRLRRASFPALRELLSVLRTLPAGVRVTIVGHASAEPDPIGRVQLAADRARAVLSWLEAHGLRREHVVTAIAPPEGVTAAPDPATVESVDIWLTRP